MAALATAPKREKKAAATPKLVKGAGAKPALVQKPTGVHRINESAMLVSLTVRRWHPHKTDEEVSQEVAAQHKASREMGKYRKRLLAKTTFKKLSTIINEIRNFHYFHTLPWSEGERILSQLGYFEYMKQLSKLRQEFDAEWRAFLPLYPALKEEAKLRMGSLYKEEDYPSIDAIATKFGVDVIVSPIPAGEDFRVDLGAAELKRVRTQLEEQSKAVIEEAIKSVWGRLQKVVQHAAERLKAYQEVDGKVEHSFRDTVVTNISELLDVIPALNITNDPKLVEFAAAIRQELTAYSGTVLRDDPKVRATVAQKADDILAKMAGFLN